MRPKWLTAAGMASIAALLIILARIILGGNEDDWVCINGSWVRHGNPAAPKPPDRTCGWPSVDLD